MTTKKSIWNVRDNSFAHDNGCVAYKPPTLIEWERTDLKPTRPTFHTYTHITEKTTTPTFLLLFESKEITRLLYYSGINSLLKNYDLIFTHYSEILHSFKNSRWIPGGGIWLKRNEWGIHEKSKVCSIVSSDKEMCQLHLYRRILTQFLSDNKVCDCFGTHFGPDKNIPIFDSLKDYAFSIIIENAFDELFFTEKLLNCFVSGTIPVYVGSKNIDTVFDSEGIIHIEDLRPESVSEIVKELSLEEYHKRIEAVKRNYVIAQQFEIMEDWIFLNYYKDIYGYFGGSHIEGVL